MDSHSIMIELPVPGWEMLEDLGRLSLGTVGFGMP